MSWINKTRNFTKEVITETRKATFPGRQELINTTVVVLVTSVVFAAYLWLSDQVISKALYWVIDR